MATAQPPARVLVKICGVTTVADALAAAEAGADWIGLNFHPASPRFLDEGRARAIVRALPPGVRAVGVFVDREVREILGIARRVGLGVIQLHGDDSPANVAAISAHLPVVRAFRLRDQAATEALIEHIRAVEALGAPAPAVLVDGYVSGLPGGTGLMVDVDLLAALPPLPRLILAGGLTPENVAERVERVRPWMVDVAGGVESAPGVKDRARVAAFVRAARGTAVDSPKQPS